MSNLHSNSVSYAEIPACLTQPISNDKSLGLYPIGGGLKKFKGESPVAMVTWHKVGFVLVRTYQGHQENATGGS